MARQYCTSIVQITFSKLVRRFTSISKQAAKKEQLRLVTEAEATCKAAQAQLRWALPGQTAAAAGAATEARAALAAELKVLSDNFAGLRKLVENQGQSALYSIHIAYMDIRMKPAVSMCICLLPCCWPLNSQFCAFITVSKLGRLAKGTRCILNISCEELRW